MQIMFGSPSLSLTFSWAAPNEELPPEGSTLSGQALTSPSGSLMEDDLVDESELLDKPFQLVLARYQAVKSRHKNLHFCLSACRTSVPCI